MRLVDRRAECGVLDGLVEAFQRWVITTPLGVVGDTGLVVLACPEI